MKRFSTGAAILALALLGCGAGPACAATGWDFLFDMARVTNDSQYFLHLAVGDAALPRQVIEPVLPRLRSVESDLPVALFLAKQSGRPLDFIVSLHSQGVSWSLIFGKCGVPIDLLYAGIDRDPGPPYGKAWGYWKKHGRSAWIPDPDVVGLVQVQLGQRFCAVPAYTLAEERGRGMSVYTVVADKKGRPWKGGKNGKGRDGDDQGGGEGGGNSHGKGQGKAKGHSK